MAANQLDFRVKNGLIVGGDTNIAGAITSVDSIQLDTALAYTPPVEGQLRWHEDEGSFAIGLDGSIVADLPEVTLYRVTNNTASTIPKGTLVASVGTTGNSGKILVSAWNPATQIPVQIMGITAGQILSGGDGHVTHFGKIRGIQTNGGNYGEVWSNGDILYAGPTGGLTKTVPAAPNTKTIIAIVISAHPSNGTLFIRPTLSSSIANDDQVQLNGLANGDLLVYNSTAGRFENSQSLNLSGPSVIDVNSTSTALRITQRGTGDVLRVEDSTNPDATPFVINADGRIVIGDSSSVFGGNLEIYENAGSPFSVFERYGTSTSTGYTLAFVKTRGVTPSAKDIVLNDDILGEIVFQGTEGTINRNAVMIRAQADGAPIADASVPGRLIFLTTFSGNASPSERMRINSTGNVLIGTTTTNTNSSLLVVNGTISETVNAVQYLVLSQADVGAAPNQVPLNQHLGNLAYADANDVEALTVGTATVDTLSSTTSTTITSTSSTINQNTAISNVMPTLNLAFAQTKTLDPRITFARASTATYYDGKTVAKAEENLLIHSQTFNLGGWSATGGVITADATVAPDGTTTAELFTANTTGTAGISQSITTGAIPHTFSVFAKAGTCTWLRLLAVGGTNAAWYDLTNGVLGTVQGSTTATITSVGNGWYRCTFTSSVGGSSTFIRLANADASINANNTTTLSLWGAQLEQRASVTAYTPTTTQPITNYIPVLQTAAAGVARFDHNPVTGESLGLLIEEQRTNFLTDSDATQTNSAGINIVIVGDTAVAPNGLINAATITANAGTAQHGISKSTTTIPASTVVTLSAYVKAGTHRYCRLDTQSVSNWSLNAGCSVDLLTGEIISGSGQVQSVGNGWYRVSIQGTSNSTAGAARGLWVWVAGADGSSSFNATGFESIFVFGMSIEVGSYPTSYIPTVASQVTRSADDASLTGVNFSSWYAANEGTLYSEYQRNGYSAASSPFDINDGTTSNHIRFVTGFANPAHQRFDVFANNVSQVTALVTSSGALKTFYKAAGAYIFNNVSATENGSTVLTDTSAIIPTNLNQALIGRAFGAQYLSGTIKKITYYPKRLSNAELQEMTQP